MKLPVLFLALALGVFTSALVPTLDAQSSSSSSSSSKLNDQPMQYSNPATRPRVAQIEEGGSAVTLEFSEPLFQMAAALNACGYDADLDKSAPVRAQVRTAMDAALAASEEARASRDALCAYVARHRLSDLGLDVGQYVSLALYLSPPPELTPNVDQPNLPPQALQVVNVLPLLRDFSQKIDLHVIWLQHRAQYEALVARVHDPMTHMLLNTNIFLHEPVSSYDGRRFLVLLEPMLSPNLTNARIYGSDYIVVTSPGNVPGDPVRMDQIRHIYLHYIVEPMVYSRGSAMERIQPMLAAVQDAPIPFFYKSDVVSLITECLIKAIEARMYTIGPAPEPPSGTRARAASDSYLAAKAVYDRKTATAQSKLVTQDDTEGWVLTSYFYGAMKMLGKNGTSLSDEIAPMIYGMDVSGQRHHAQQIVFVRASSDDPLSPSVSPPPLVGMELAELDLMKGKADDAADLADKAIADPHGDHAAAQYVLARIHLMQGDPEKAMHGFEQTLALSKDPRTVAWSHIYLGRLYDTMNPPNRPQAVAQYKQALATRDSRPDTREAAESGIKKPFALPQRAASPSAGDDADAPFDPTGKAQKEAYKPNVPPGSSSQPDPQHPNL